MTKVPTITLVKNNSEWYSTIGFIVGILTFIGVWIYAMGQWGFLIGIMAGWIPAAIAAVIAGFVWPLAALVLGWLLLTSL